MNSNIQDTIKNINVKCSELATLSHDELRAKAIELRDKCRMSENQTDFLDSNLVLAFAIVKETAQRFTSIPNITVQRYDVDAIESADYFSLLPDNKVEFTSTWDVQSIKYTWDMVHYDEQILAGVILHQGKVAEMATGEGKTLVATLPVYLNALTGKGVHLMTVNKYLSIRDFELTRPIYHFLGLTVGCIERFEHGTFERGNQYHADIVFGTNSGFVFDYLYDHIAEKQEDCVQKGFNFAIIDEADSILIDEAATPHKISGNNYDLSRLYIKFNPVVKEIVANSNASNYFKLSNKKDALCWTEEGHKELELKCNYPDLYNDEEDEKEERIHKEILRSVLFQLLCAYTIKEKDKDYIVSEDKIIIIDQNTGRIKPSHRWSNGLHAAVEAKEGVTVIEDNSSIARISLKNFFLKYPKKAGMTGTASSAKDELKEVYSLEVESIPTHRKKIRVDYPLKIYKDKNSKNKAIIQLIKEIHTKGRPILIGCSSVKETEELSDLLIKEELEHTILNAKNLEEEAIIISKAGNKNTITLSTSIAGRGTDIKLGEGVKDLGGLSIIATTLFDSERIDEQLRGRAGRQGDAGTSNSFCSIDDSIIKYLSNDNLNDLVQLSENCDESGEIHSPKAIELIKLAQKDCKQYLFERRKSITKKDDKIALFRNEIYNYRDEILFNGISEDELNKYSFTKNDLSNKIVSLVKQAMQNQAYLHIIKVPIYDGKNLFTEKCDIEELIQTNGRVLLSKILQKLKLQLIDSNMVSLLNDIDTGKIDIDSSDLSDRFNEIRKNIKQEYLQKIEAMSIPVNTTCINKVAKPNYDNKRGDINPTPKIVNLHDICPCGSGKQFYLCHGRNRMNNLG